MDRFCRSPLCRLVVATAAVCGYSEAYTEQIDFFSDREERSFEESNDYAAETTQESFLGPDSQCYARVVCREEEDGLEGATTTIRLAQDESNFEAASQFNLYINNLCLADPNLVSIDCDPDAPSTILLAFLTSDFECRQGDDPRCTLSYQAN